MMNSRSAAAARPGQSKCLPSIPWGDQGMSTETCGRASPAVSLLTVQCIYRCSAVRESEDMPCTLCQMAKYLPHSCCVSCYTLAEINLFKILHCGRSAVHVDVAFGMGGGQTQADSNHGNLPGRQTWQRGRLRRPPPPEPYSQRPPATPAARPCTSAHLRERICE